MQRGLADAPALWERFRKSFYDNLREEMSRQQKYNALPIDLEDLQTDLGLILLNQLLLGSWYTLSDFNLPQYQHEWQEQKNNWLIANELNYDINKQEQLRVECYN